MNQKQLRALRARRARTTALIDTAKHNIAELIAAELSTRGMTQTEASHLTGEAPSQISLVTTGKLRGFSLERLLRLRIMLHGDITIRVSGVSDPAASGVSVSSL